MIASSEGICPPSRCETETRASRYSLPSSWQCVMASSRNDTTLPAHSVAVDDTPPTGGDIPTVGQSSLHGSYAAGSTRNGRHRYGRRPRSPRPEFAHVVKRSCTGPTLVDGPGENGPGGRACRPSPQGISNSLRTCLYLSCSSRCRPLGNPLPRASSRFFRAFALSFPARYA